MRLNVGVEENSLMSLDSNTEKDTEYTEKYASLPRTILKSPQVKPRYVNVTPLSHKLYLSQSKVFKVFNGPNRETL